MARKARDNIRRKGLVTGLPGNWQIVKSQKVDNYIVDGISCDRKKQK